MTVLTLPQGVTRTIAVNGIVDSTGAPLNVTGWAVLATAIGPGVAAPVVAQWSTSPIGTQGTATASGSAVTLQIPSTMTTTWLLHYAILDIRLTEPGVGGRTERFDPVGLIITP